MRMYYINHEQRFGTKQIERERKSNWLTLVECEYASKTKISRTLELCGAESSSETVCTHSSNTYSPGDFFSTHAGTCSNCHSLPRVSLTLLTVLREDLDGRNRQVRQVEEEKIGGTQMRIRQNSLYNRHVLITREDAGFSRPPNTFSGRYAHKEWSQNDWSAVAVPTRRWYKVREC